MSAGTYLPSLRHRSHSGWAEMCLLRMHFHALPYFLLLSGWLSIAVVLPCHQLLMLPAVLAVPGKFGAAGVAAWPLGLSWHRFTSLGHKKSHPRNCSVNGPVLSYFSDSIIPQRRGGHLRTKLDISGVFQILMASWGTFTF